MRIPIPKTSQYYTRREYADEGAWLGARCLTIGASEVPIVLGIAPKSWGSARDLWLEKRGESVGNDEGNEDTFRGHRTEPHIRELFQIRHPNLKVYDGTNCIFRSREYPWLSCSLDMIIEDENGDLYVGEIKDVRYTSLWKGDEYPRHYRYQVITQLLITGWKGAILLPNISYEFCGDGKFLDDIEDTSVRERRIVIRRSEVRSQFRGIVRETLKFHDAVVGGYEPEVVMGR